MSDQLIRIAAEVARGIEAHALSARPAECCGLLSGAAGLITRLHPLRNEAARPETRYFAAPEDLFAAMRGIRAAGHGLLGIYHSHPRAPAYPSPADVQMAFYPEAAYFIISLEPRPDLRAFRIAGARVVELGLNIVMSDE